MRPELPCRASRPAFPGTAKPVTFCGFSCSRYLTASAGTWPSRIYLPTCPVWQVRKSAGMPSFALKTFNSADSATVTVVAVLPEMLGPAVAAFAGRAFGNGDMDRLSGARAFAIGERGNGGAAQQRARVW